MRNFVVVALEKLCIVVVFLLPIIGAVQSYTTAVSLGGQSAGIIADLLGLLGGAIAAVFAVGVIFVLLDIRASLRRIESMKEG